MNGNGIGESSPKLFETKNLPCDDWSILWDRIILEEAWRTRLKNYARMFTNGILSKMPTSKIIAFEGLPGLGKTTLARGFANYVALQLGGVAYGVEINAEEWRSQWLGDPAKRVKKAFAAITLLAKRAPVIVIIDELESVALSRKRTMETAEPSDVITAVAELLIQLDRLGTLENVMVIVTTNLAAAIDEAFSDRVDFKFEFSLPDCATREQILRDEFLRLRERGIDIETEGIEQLAEGTEGLSGRQLSRLPMRAMLEKNDGDFSLETSHLMRAVQLLKHKPETPIDLGARVVSGSNGHGALVH